MSIVPSFGGNPEDYVSRFNAELAQRNNTMIGANAARHNALLEAQTADLDRRGDAFTAILNNMDQLTSALGSRPALAAMLSGVDPARGIPLSPDAAQYTSQYGLRSDDLRQFGQFADAYAQAGRGTRDFVDGAGRMPNLAAVGRGQWPGFTNVPRGAEVGGRSGNVSLMDTMYRLVNRETGETTNWVHNEADLSDILASPAWQSAQMGGQIHRESGGLTRDGRIVPLTDTTTSPASPSAPRQPVPDAAPQGLSPEALEVLRRSQEPQ